MPYKHHEDFVAWNREYQRKRSAGERKDRATVEGRIIKIVREEPSQHEVLTLYAQLQPEGWPVKMVERAVQDLLKARVLHWDGRRLPTRLALNDRTHNPFAASQPAPAGDVESRAEKRRRRSSLLSELQGR